MIMKIKRSITVRTEFAALHRYKDAPEEVSFLRNLHRHCFKVSVSLDVKNSDRELEFFMVQTQVEGIIRVILNACEYENDLPIMGSCEDMAEKIALTASSIYERSVGCMVSEDGENSAEVYIRI